ncbi:MAG: hypothetical protein JXP72_08785 [Coriobacteriia bacterium]|nr:hypothetical protein [Coriobacteriia bacterium]
MFRWILVLVLMLAFATVLGACSAGPTVPDADPSIRGAITSLSPGKDGEVSILVEAAGAPLFDYDKASVNVTMDSCVLLQRADGSLEQVAQSDLTIGQEVDVWLEGPVAESYPVQAYGATVLIRN